MQAPDPLFSCVPATFLGIKRAISPVRLARYVAAAKRDEQLALRLYTWNLRLCEEFYLPLHFAEVSYRNAMHAGLISKFGYDWHRNPGLISSMPNRLQEEVDDVVKRQRQQHGLQMTPNHVVSGLTLGFWLHFSTKNARSFIWKNDFLTLLPYVDPVLTGGDVHDMLDKMRVFRNRIAHHECVYDKGPNIEYKNIRKIISWTNPEILFLLAELVSPSRIMSMKPRI